MHPLPVEQRACPAATCPRKWTDCLPSTQSSLVCTLHRRHCCPQAATATGDRRLACSTVQRPHQPSPPTNVPSEDDARAEEGRRPPASSLDSFHRLSCTALQSSSRLKASESSYCGGIVGKTRRASPSCMASCAPPARRTWKSSACSSDLRAICAHR